MTKRNPNLTPPILCTVVIAIMILVGLIGVTLWYFFFPGINKLFDYTHFIVEEKGYILNANGQIIKEATLTAKGTAKIHHTGKSSNREGYDFNFEITGYSTVDHSASLWVLEDGMPRLSTSWQDVEPISDRDSTEINVKKQINYTTYLDEDYSEIIGCVIESIQFSETGSGSSRDPSVYFIPADTAEEAHAQFALLLERIG